MNFGRFILSQLLDLVDRKTLSRLVERYGAESRVRHFGCRQQFIAMVFAQLTWREGLRDIVDCLNARPTARYHLGFREPLAKSTLADANEQRDWRLWQDLAQNLMAKARPLYPKFLENSSQKAFFDGFSFDVCIQILINTIFG
jgi:hypothetical protein